MPSARIIFALFAMVPVASAQTFVDEWSLDTKQHVFSIAISPDGKMLAAGNDNIHLYDLTGAQPRQITVIESQVFVGVRGLMFSPDSKRIAFGGSDRGVHLWTVDGEPKELSVGKSHAGDTVTMAFSRDGKLLASGSNDKTVILWNVGETGKLTENLIIKQPDKYDGQIRAVAFMGTNKLITANHDGVIRLLALTKDGKYKQEKIDKLRDVSREPSLAVRSDGKTFAITNKNSIGLGGGLQGVYTGHDKEVSGLAFSPDDSVLASCGQDGRICLFAGVATTPRTSKERPDQLTCIAFPAYSTEVKPAKETFLAAGANTGKVFVYKVSLPDAKKK